jgi:hypothetical protein
VHEGVEVVIVDNAEAEAIGTWRRGRFGRYHGEDYSFASGGNGTNSIEFIPRLTTTGQYDVYEWHVAGGNRAASVPYEIIHSHGTNVVRVDQQRAGSKWNYLGRFSFLLGSSGRVRVNDAVPHPDTVVIADAIRFVRPLSASRASHDSAISQKESLESGIALDKTVRARENFFMALKVRHQPAWTEVPSLPWKTNPKNGIITGTVTKRGTGDPVYNAVISLVNAPGRTQRTDPHGSYALFEVPAGFHEITVQAEDLRATTVKVEVRAGAVVAADLALTPR